MTRQVFSQMGRMPLALVPVWFLELFVLNRFPLWGGPMPLPLVAVCVAVLEGHHSGAGFGLFVGILCDGLLQHRRSHDGGAVPLIGVGGPAPWASMCCARTWWVPVVLPSRRWRSSTGVRIAARLLAGAGGAGRHARPGRTGDSLVPGLCVPGVRPVPVGVPPGAEKPCCKDRPPRCRTRVAS